MRRQENQPKELRERREQVHEHRCEEGPEAVPAREIDDLERRRCRCDRPDPVEEPYVHRL